VPRLIKQQPGTFSAQILFQGSIALIRISCAASLRFSGAGGGKPAGWGIFQGEAQFHFLQLFPRLPMICPVASRPDLAGWQ
jgi:hypothetical protein